MLCTALPAACACSCPVLRCSISQCAIYLAVFRPLMLVLLEWLCMASSSPALGVGRASGASAVVCQVSIKAPYTAPSSTTCLSSLHLCSRGLLAAGGQRCPESFIGQGAGRHLLSVQLHRESHCCACPASSAAQRLYLISSRGSIACCSAISCAQGSTTAEEQRSSGGSSSGLILNVRQRAWCQLLSRQLQTEILIPSPAACICTPHARKTHWVQSRPHASRHCTKHGAAGLQMGKAASTLAVMWLLSSAGFLALCYLILGGAPSFRPPPRRSPCSDHTAITVFRKLVGVVMISPCSTQGSSGMTDVTHLTLGGDLGGR